MVADFNPIQFLNVNVSKLSEAEIKDLRNHLSSKIGEYILLKLSDHFTPEQQARLADITTPEQLQELLSVIPQWNEKVNIELINFKTEYLSKLQKGSNG